MAASTEVLRIHRYLDTNDNQTKLDLRYWRRTSKAERPTGRSITIAAGMLTRLIRVLQQEHAAISSEAAKAAVGAD